MSIKNVRTQWEGEFVRCGHFVDKGGERGLSGANILHTRGGAEAHTFWCKKYSC